jgi:DNA-binding NarL/FixJ family response regulator
MKARRMFPRVSALRLHCFRISAIMISDIGPCCPCQVTRVDGLLQLQPSLHWDRAVTTSVIIADDHAGLRTALRQLIDDEPDMRVVAEAEDGDGALRLVHEHRPDVLLADISMPGPSGIQLAAALRNTVPSTRVLIVTMYEGSQLVRDAIAAGAAGYLVKQKLDGGLAQAIRAVAGGGPYFPADLASPPPVAPGAMAGGIAPEQLAADDLALLRRIGRGRTQQQIAAELGVSPEVVKDRQGELLHVLGLRTRTELMSYAHAHGLVG